jgi:hypothetical protein
MIKYILFVAHIIFHCLTTFASDISNTSKQGPLGFQVQQSDMQSLLRLSWDFMILIDHSDIGWELSSKGVSWVTEIVQLEKAEKIKNDMAVAFRPYLTNEESMDEILTIVKSSTNSGYRVLILNIAKFIKLIEQICTENNEEYLNFLKKNGLVLEDTIKAQEILNDAFRERQDPYMIEFAQALRQDLKSKLPENPRYWTKTFFFSSNNNKLYLRCQSSTSTLTLVGSIWTALQEKWIREWSSSDIQLVLRKGSEYPSTQLIKYSDTIVYQDKDEIYGFDASGVGWVIGEIPGLKKSVQKHVIEDLATWRDFHHKRPLKDISLLFPDDDS